jgi:hypothetical protein
MGRAHFCAKFGLSTLYFSIVDTLFFAQNLGENSVSSMEYRLDLENGNNSQ